VYKEGTDRTLLGPIQVTAVYGTGVIRKLWYCCVFGKDTKFVGCSQTVVRITVYSLVIRCD